MSPIMESFYQSTGIDVVYILAAVLLLELVLFILLITALVKIKKLNRKYSRFMRGNDGKTLEDAIMTSIDKAELVEEKNRVLENDIINLRKSQKITFQKAGMVKYNAFREMSGDLSYALAVLDSRDNGFLINSVYTKEGGYSYIKEITDGKSAIELSEDEKAALDKAIGR